MSDAIYFDGQTARRRKVEIGLTGSTLTIAEGDQTLARWPLAALRELESLPGQLKLRSTDAPELANLVTTDAGFAAALKGVLPNIPQDAVRHQTSRLKIVGLSMGAVASVLTIVFFVIPLMSGMIARAVPDWFERRLGDSVAVQVKDMFSAEVCSSPAGTRALNKLAGMLTDKSDLRHPVRIDVLKTPVYNAIALPGGQVFLFDGLLQKAQNVDEIAGVLGHEIGHEAARDGLTGIIRSGGTAFLLGLLFGDVAGSTAVLFVTRQLIDSSHSRDAESRADDFGRRVMHALDRPAADMARLLVRISGAEKDKGNIFASHPMSKERLERLQQADAARQNPVNGEALLTPGEWTALRNICKDD